MGWIRQASTGDGDGGSGVAAGLVQLENTANAEQGIEISADVDASWALRGQLRRVAHVPSTVDFPISDATSVRLTMPTEFFLGTDGNERSIVLEEGRAAVAAVPAGPDVRAYANFQLASGGDPGIRLTFAGNRADTLAALGNDWFFTTSSGGATVTININNTTQTITLDFPSGSTLSAIKAALDGYDVNGISFDTAYLNGADGSESTSGVSSVSQGFLGGADGSPAVPAVPRGPFISSNGSTVGFNSPNFRITVEPVAGDTLATMIAGIAAAQVERPDGNGNFTWGADNVGKADAGASDDALADVGSVADPMSVFAGGLDPEPITVVSDEASQLVTIKYSPAEDTMEEVRAVVDGDEDLGAVLIYGTAQAATPEDPPFTRAFSGAVGAEPNTGAAGGPHSHEFTVDPYGDVETWTRANNAVFATERLYRTGIEVDQTREFLHIGLVVNEDNVPRQLGYQRIRTAEWAELELDVLADNAVFQENDEKSGVLVFPTDDRFNVISFHLRRYQNAADDDLLSVGVFINASDTPSGDIIGIKYFYEDKTVEKSTEEAGAAAGASSGGASNYLLSGALPDVLNASHVKRIYNVAGHLQIIKRRHRDGMLNVTWTHYGAGTAIGLNIGQLWGLAADAYRWRGVHERGSQISGANDDDVYMNPGGGFFVYNNESFGATGWLHLRAPDGWDGRALSEADADSQIHANGRVYEWNNQLHKSSDYSREDEIVQFRAEDYDQHAEVYSMVQFWGPEQDEALPSGQTNRAGLVYLKSSNARYLRYPFKNNEPDAILVGADPGVRALDAADVANADLMTSSVGGTANEVLADKRVIKLPVGYVYRVHLIGQHDATTDVSLSVWIYEIMAGDDDLMRQHGVGYQTTVRDPLEVHTEAEATVMDVNIDRVFDCRTAEKLITAISGGFTATGANGHWYLEIERIG